MNIFSAPLQVSALLVQLFYLDETLARDYHYILSHYQLLLHLNKLVFRSSVLEVYLVIDIIFNKK